MKLHGNARTCPHSRLLAVQRVQEQGWTLARAADAAGVSVRTISKFVRRYKSEGELHGVAGSDREAPSLGPRGYRR